MKIIRVKDYDELSLEGTKIVGEFIKNNPQATLGLATGSSPIGLYQNLIKMFQNKEISFKEIKTYNLDEYCGLPKSHPESYYSFMYRNLFSHVDIKDENIHIPSSEGEDMQKNCDDYNRLLHQTTIDLQLLGIGGNGHIGFNEPGTPFDRETFLVKLAERTRQDNKMFFKEDEEVPHYAITMGIKNIMEAKKIVMLISGKSKAEAVKRLLSGEITTNFPASILHKHPDVTVIIDEPAAALI
ncbi:MAG TPA: glucosamine-6-phosphate deaminase [Bacilli bacterium]|jgi:glucosamine-6-phosphate deaminase|nr:glucosamine-6-phosphate deaminase [Acholeplasmataceae bacterium]HNZ78177.1 glucosamine-6-phosphate deaminase [Bacilli bacterium]HOD61287.1 glucosamine-6-phosphate deaminase [Bacilli bacterium]HOH62072.1 glucosamine-6-phosphate deaminase [Bacilli bacterium]HPM14812.1 glucosamine-6-phosphate deaminase [Bacilli bacterium]